MRVVREFSRTVLVAVIVASLLTLPLPAQQSDKNIPDAPSVGRSPQQLPDTGPIGPAHPSPSAPAPDTNPPPAIPPPDSGTELPAPTAPGVETSTGTATSRDAMFTLTKTVNFVIV